MTDQAKILNRIITVFAAVVLVLCLCTSTKAQQSARIPRIGFLTGGGNPFSFETFKQGLRNLGYVEGKNITIEYRSAEGDQERVANLVTELVQLKVDVLTITSSPGVLAAKQATKTIPVVIVTQADPVAAGLIDSLARPGGNITGISSLSRDLSGNRLELLKEVVPKLSRVGVLWDTTDPTSASIGFKQYEVAALALKTQLQSVELRGPNPNLDGAFQSAVNGRVSALITIRNPLTNRHQKQIVDLTIKHRLPSMYERSDYVDAGGLISYSSNDAENYRRAAYYVDKILKGAKPADLTVEQPAKFELVINLKTAKQIGVTIPPDVLARATKITFGEGRATADEWTLNGEMFC